MAGPVRLRRLLATFLGLFGLAGPAAAGDIPERVVSINLCADQYLLALTEPARIAAVSRFARDPGLSYLVEQANAVPVISGAAEEVIRLDPDLVLTGAFTRRTTADLLERFGYRVVAVPYAETIADVREGLIEVARVLGIPERGEALAADLDAAIAGAAGDGVERPTILHYQSRGFVTGSRTLLGDLLDQAGFHNMAADLGVPSLGRVQLEQVVAARPQRLLVDGDPSTAPGVGQAVPEHPSLAAVLPERGRVPLPDGLVTCGGPSTAAALAYLTRAGHAMPEAGPPG